MKVDPGIVRRGITIMTVAPTVTALIIYSRLAIAIMIGLMTFIALLEWTAMKRHVKVNLLLSPSEADALLPTKEYATPVAKTNLFILVKCFMCTLLIMTVVLGQECFHAAMTAYFLFWVIFTLLGENKAETTVIRAKKEMRATPVSTPTTDLRRTFAAAELGVLTTKFTTELFMSFCLEYFGFVWVSGLSHAMLLYDVPQYGILLVLTVLISNWANDIAALIVGRSLKGRTHPLYPKISPNKSLEGAIAGVIMNGVFAMLLIRIFGSHLHFLEDFSNEFLFFTLGVIFGVIGVIGDLLQSLFKRIARLKDTGAVFPGHGGVLDRIDGLLIVFPAAYWLLWLLLQWRVYRPWMLDG